VAKHGNNSSTSKAAPTCWALGARIDLVPTRGASGAGLGYMFAPSHTRFRTSCRCDALGVRTIFNLLGHSQPGRRAAPAVGVADPATWARAAPGAARRDGR
jgi:anthranilate phosphoribosyltransferase